MSLCTPCFTAGNHEGHDFNKFKSQSGGACDCGDETVMKQIGCCRFHGPKNIQNRPTPPEELIAPLRCLLPWFISALLYWLLDGLSHPSPNFLTGEFVPALYVLHLLHACGWVALKTISDVLLDQRLYTSLMSECEESHVYQNYIISLSTHPGIGQSVDLSEELEHTTLLDAFIYCTVKLRFPEDLVTFLIGLLTVSEFKIKFVDSYLDHYTRIAASVIKSARSRMHFDASIQLNSRIIHVSVQLFCAEQLALKLVDERRLHLLILTCLYDMCMNCRTRLDDKGNMVVSCDGPLIQNNVFWPFVSDLGNLVSHRSIVQRLIGDDQFMRMWTDVLSSLQTESAICLRYTQACVGGLTTFLSRLGHFISPAFDPAPPVSSATRSPFSLHLPLTRHVACFTQLSCLVHGHDLASLMSPLMTTNSYLMRRFMHELANVLLGHQEVAIGYWIRNGQALRRAVYHYISCQYCHSFIELDIFALQICLTLLPPVYFLNSMLDSSRLMRDICLPDLMTSLVTRSPDFVVDRKSIALERFFITICYVLDIRTNMGLSTHDLMKKETICVLAPESRKRSDISYYMPERCGVEYFDVDLSTILDEIATFSEPSFDERSGNLVSGRYALRPNIWHTDFDPILQTLRSLAQSETVTCLTKYRDHCRLRHNFTNTLVLWPPYRLPSPLPAQFADLENLLASRHFHYLLFIQLCLFSYGHPLVSEECLGLIIHLLNRIIDKIDAHTPASFDLNPEANQQPFDPPPPSDVLPDWDPTILTCPYDLASTFKDNVFTWLCLSPTGIEAVSTMAVTALAKNGDQPLTGLVPSPQDKSSSHIIDSLASLLVKVHAKLHLNRTLASTDPGLCFPTDDANGEGFIRSGAMLGGASSSSMTSPEELTSRLAPELQYWSLTPPAYAMPDERPARSPNVLDQSDPCFESQTKSDQVPGDGASYVERLLDKMVQRLPQFATTLRFYLLRARNPRSIVLQPLRSATEATATAMEVDQTSLVAATSTSSVQPAIVTQEATTIDERKRKARERQERMFAQMKSRQDRIAAQVKSLEDAEQSTTESGHICVFCQTTSQNQMVYLGIICESGAMINMSETGRRPTLQSRLANPQEAPIVSGQRIVADRPPIEPATLSSSSSAGWKAPSGTVGFSPPIASNRMTSSGINDVATQVQQSSAAPPPALYVESRRWWATLLLDALVNNKQPLLANGLLLQTCGHTAHVDCFTNYRNQARRSGLSRIRTLLTCPLCRREIHYTMPLATVPDPSHLVNQLPHPSQAVQCWSSLLDQLNNLEQNSRSLWTDLSSTELEDRHSVLRPVLDRQHAAAVLLSILRNRKMLIPHPLPGSSDDFLLYLRTLYQHSTDLTSLIYCLHLVEMPPCQTSKDETSSDHVFALCQDPGDILMALLPYIWPDEAKFLVVSGALFVLTYVRALISTLVNRTSSLQNEDEDIGSLRDQLPSELHQHAFQLLLLLELIRPAPLSSTITKQDSRCSESLLAQASRLPDDLGAAVSIELHIKLRLLPFLRLAAMTRSRWHQACRVDQEHQLDPLRLPFTGLHSTDSSSLGPEVYLTEFAQLCQALLLASQNDNDLGLIGLLRMAERAAVNCALVDLTPRSDADSPPPLTQLIGIWTNQLMSSAQQDHDVYSDSGYLPALIECGRQLYPPRLIRPPDSYDVLFNALHDLPCRSSKGGHKFQDNSICLVCGRLLCAVCVPLTTLLVEHAFACTGFSCILLEVNTSMIYVVLGYSYCPWSSIYLDQYGEEDPELKRGKLLFLNQDRFTLLENQWITHSFRQQLKSWRHI